MSARLRGWLQLAVLADLDEHPAGRRVSDLVQAIYQDGGNGAQCAVGNALRALRGAGLTIQSSTSRPAVWKITEAGSRECAEPGSAVPPDRVLHCDRHPGAGRYPSGRYDDGKCAECSAEYHRALYLRKRPNALAELVGGDVDLAAKLSAFSDLDLGFLAVALRAARQAGRAAERQAVLAARLRKRGQVRDELGKHIQSRIAYFGQHIPSGARLRDLRAMAAEARAQEQAVVDQLRAIGLSDSDIAAEIGVTKQAVQKGYPRQPKVAGRPDPDGGRELGDADGQPEALRCSQGR